MWESVSDAIPDRVALVQGARRVSWSQFDDRAARLAAAFTAAGLAPNSKVASYLYNSNEYSEGVYATFKMRGVPANVNYRYLEDELAYLIDNSDAEALLFHGELGDHVAKVRAQAPNVKLWVQVDDGAPQQDFAVPYEELLAAHDPMPRIERSGDDLYFLYTGGTTGMPKGVMWRNEDLVKVLLDSAYTLVGAAPPAEPEAAGEVARKIVASGIARMHLPASPLMHGTGGFTSFQAMFAGTGVVTLENRHFDAHELWQTVQRERVTQMAIVGDAFAKPMVRALEEAEAKGEPYDISSLQLIISSGVMWSPETKQAFMSRGQIICFDSLGSSEGVGFAGSIDAPGSAPTTAKFTIGADTKVFTDDGREVPPGSDEVGMLAVGGNIPIGYYKDESKSAATFRVINGEHWSVPGDFARVNADKSIVLLGRGSVVINSGGEKVFPEEVEAAVRAHPDVFDAVVVGVPDDRFGQKVVALVKLRPGAAELTLAALQEHCRTKLAGYKVPRSLLVGEAPRTNTNKPDYAAAQEIARARLARLS
jgi:fatty-acyl-CoA synthase